ncbi:hypothetical protein ABZ471_40570 [Streptomyces sp. NPDC005728]|uniref:hypothetical protein n=1 Tax=Streptomyces sp. NPDC005728 TaxID=3157054 RepID=UPI0033FDAF5F
MHLRPYGPGVKLRVELPGRATHLNAYRSGDVDPCTARRCFESRVDQHLHQVLPPATDKPFYE